MNHELEMLISRMLASGFSFDDTLRLTKRALLKQAMYQERGNQCRAARYIGVHRNTMQRYLKEAQLDPRTGNPRYPRKPARSVAGVVAAVAAVKSGEGPTDHERRGSGTHSRA